MEKYNCLLPAVNGFNFELVLMIRISIIRVTVGNGITG